MASKNYARDDEVRAGTSRAQGRRRVVIEEDQRRKLEHARVRGGYADDVGPDTYGRETFQLINERAELDRLPHSDYVLETLDRWKFWLKMRDWDSINSLLEDLMGKLRRREATGGELQFVLVVCAPAWRAVARQLQRFGGVDLDPGAGGFQQFETAQRANELDREEIDHVAQNALLDALVNCPRPFPRHFFGWLRGELARRALAHVHAELAEGDRRFVEDAGIDQVLSKVLRGEVKQGSLMYWQWIRSHDLDSMFELAREYAPYARVRSACEAAVDRLPRRQRIVIQERYYQEMTQAAIAAAHGVADSTIRNTHSQALGNLRRDDDLFSVLEAVGRVRDLARRNQLTIERGQDAALAA